MLSKGLWSFFFCGLLLIFLVACTSDSLNSLFLSRDVSSSLIQNSAYIPPLTLRSPFQEVWEHNTVASTAETRESNSSFLKSSQRRNTPFKDLKNTLNPLLFTNQKEAGSSLAFDSYIPGEKHSAVPANRSDELPLCSGELGEEGEWIYAPESVESSLKYEVWGECIKTSRFSCNKKYHKYGVTDKASIEVRMKEANK